MKMALTLGLAASFAISGLAHAETKKTICRAETAGATAGVLADASTGVPLLDAKKKQIPCNLPQAQNGVPGVEGALGSTAGLSTTAVVVGGVVVAGAIAGGVAAGTSGGCKLVPISGGATCM